MNVHEGVRANGANLRVFQESFRRRLFDVAGDPFRVGVWSEGGSFLGGVF